MTVRGMLFDLDGTLADTAPDLVLTLNTLLREAGEPPVPYAIARNEVSNGALGLLRLGLRLDREAAIDETLRQRFLHVYADNICAGTRLFLEISRLEAICTETGAKWGIVTNKPAALTQTLLTALGSCESAACVVAGDTLAQRKPHPAPLLHAADLLDVEPSACVYVGDSSRDIEAGRAAGMLTIAAAYGYIRFSDHVEHWGAGHTARNPAHVYDILGAMTRKTRPA